MKHDTCFRCGSEKVIGRKELGDGGKNAMNTLQVTLGHRDPNAILFTEPVLAPAHALVCGSCGHIELSVDNPPEVWAAYLALPKGSGGPAD